MDPRVRDGASLAALVRGYRQAALLTQRELAARAGLSLGLVRSVEQGRTRRPGPGSLRALAAALSLSPAQAGDLERAAAGRGLWLQVLGPLAAWQDGVAVPLGGPAQRAVLGLLALSAGSLVHRAMIIDVLWPSSPPANAVNLVQAHLSRLRKILGSGQVPGDGGLLSSAGASYRLRAGPGQLDLARFGQVTAEARAASSGGDHEGACGLYQQALDLWRGEPLADVDLLAGSPQITGLSQRRAEAVIGYARAASAAGWHERVLTPLRELVGREPLHEQAHAQLMIALAGCGQQAGALALYDGLRRRLDDELGMPPGPDLAQAHQLVLRQDIPAPAALAAPGRSAGARRVEEVGSEPGPALRELHERILGADQALAMPELVRAGPRNRPEKVVPRELPGTATHFAGREAELAVLTQILERGADEAPGAAMIGVISGTAGVGKTALAIYWAHQVATGFPDGQLYVNLRGYDSSSPVHAADTLAGFLRSLGVPDWDIPLEEGERAVRYRSLLAGRRMLIVLDNAQSAPQVRPLLPGTRACMTIVTSRDSLAGLVARDGAVRLTLDLLPGADAIGLLAALVGDRATIDPRATAMLAARCSRLPLALRIAAELAAARPATPLADLAAELANQQRRLDRLDDTADPGTAVRTVFSWSLRALDPVSAAMFRLASLHPGPDLDRHAAAALSGLGPDHADHVLARLARAHLLEPVRQDRYGMHDLLRAYSRELAMAQETEEERRVALARLFDYYLHTAAAAMATLVPAENEALPAADLQMVSALSPAGDAAAARGWLEAERASLVAVAAHAAPHGWPGHATRLSGILFRYLDAGGYSPEALTIHTHARDAARQVGDCGGEASALTSLGVVELRHGRSQRAAGHFHRALALLGEAQNRTGQARVLGRLGLVEHQHGRYQRATSYHLQALALFRETGHKAGEAYTLTNLAAVDLQVGLYEQASGRLAQALALARQTGHRTGEAYALGHLAAVDLRTGRYELAGGRLVQALALARQTGHRTGEAYALIKLATVDMNRGRPRSAVGLLRQALTVFRETPDRPGEVEALNGLGELLLATDQPGDARVQHAAALRLAGQIGYPYEQARGHNGIARGYHAVGDAAQADRHWHEATTIYASLGTPEAGQVRI